MSILSNDDLHLKFLLGQSVQVDGIGEFHSPLLPEIVDLTEQKYNQSISALLIDKKNIEGNDEIENYTNFQILSSILYHDDSFRESFFCGLELHFGNRPSVELLHEHGIALVYFGELNDDSVVDEGKFEYIRKLTTIANNISIEEEEKIEAGNERARKFMEEQKKRKALLAKYKKPKVSLHSIISAVGWKAKGFNFINKLNIYQLYNGYSRFQLFDNYHYTMSGIYAGTIDGSKIKLEDINWANIFNTK